MKARWPVGTMVLLALGSAASAVYPAEAPANNAIFIHGKDVKQITVYAWERDGALFHAFAGDGQEIPSDAAKYLVRRFQFPGGQFREIYYAKGVQIQPHATHNEDIISYTLSGRRAQIVNDRVWEADAGDFLYYPAGSIHHGEALLDSVNVEIGVAHPDMPGDEGAWVSGNATSETPVAEWLVAGKSRVAYGADAARAPAGAAHYTVKKFNIGRYAVDEVYMPKGTKIAAGLAAVSGDEIMYMVKGRQRVTVGNTTDEAAAGDAVREVVGQFYASEALEDSIYIALVLSATSN